MVNQIEVFNEVMSPALPLGTGASDDSVQIREIEGLGPVKADVASTPYATGRGEFFQGSSTGIRNIVLTLGLNPNWVDQTISGLRKLLYAYFMPEQIARLRFHTDEYPVVDISGVVESFEPNIFSEDPEVQVSIICPKPDFVDADATILRGFVPNSLADGEVYEYELDYEGTAPAGFDIRVTPTDELEEYTGRLVVVNQVGTDYQTFETNPATIDADQYFNLVTDPGNREVETVVLEGPDIDLLSKMVSSSRWVMFKPGVNIFSVGAMESGLKWELVYKTRFGGL